jgi:hypothetical protein
MLIFTVGGLVGVVYVVFPWSGFTFGVPGGAHSLISYVIFFVGGLIAAKNRWMDEVMQVRCRNLKQICHLKKKRNKSNPLTLDE